MSFITVLLGLVLGFLLAALIIYAVGRLGLGLEVDSFGSAIIAALVIAVVTWLIVWLLSIFGIHLGGTGLWAAIISLVVSAIVLMVSDKFVSGMRVKGFTGALIAAAAIAVGHYLVTWVLGLFGNMLG